MGADASYIRYLSVVLYLFNKKQRTKDIGLGLGFGCKMGAVM